jgi:hypothetical protein
MIRILAGLILCLLSGCAAAPVTPAGMAFDGSYTGQSVLIRGGGYLCGAPDFPLTLSVGSGRFDYPFTVNLPRTTPIAVQIAVDGSFVANMLYGTQNYLLLSHYENQWVTVRGRIAGGTLDATVTDDRCTRRITAQRT